VQVDIRLRKEVPVKTDTKATLKLKGITGVVFIELGGGNPGAPTLLASMREGQIPEIPSEKSSLAAIFDLLPKLLEKFSAIENQVKKVVTDIGAVTSDIKENPSLLLRAPKEKTAPADKKAPGNR
jgi:phospholipid/cholesterol/gamma-HCH transport system substrate-binding protein